MKVSNLLIISYRVQFGTNYGGKLFIIIVLHYNNNIQILHFYIFSSPAVHRLEDFLGYATNYWNWS